MKRQRGFVDEGWFILLLIVGLVGLFAGLIYASIQEEREWEAFKAAHDCKVVAKISGSTTTGVGPVIGGKGGVAVTIVPIPGKTGWLCDDGVTYYRDN